MLQRVSVACKFDEILLIRTAGAGDEGSERAGGGQWRDSVELLGEEEPGVVEAVSVARRALRVVEEALGESSWRLRAVWVMSE